MLVKKTARNLMQIIGDRLRRVYLSTPELAYPDTLAGLFRTPFTTSMIDTYT